MDKPKSPTCFCTKPWNCGYNKDGWCDFHNISCGEICIAYGGGAPMTNRDASAALGCALQWNGSGQYDHDAAKEAVRVAQSALEKIPKMEDQIRELTKMVQQLERERDAAVRTARWQIEKRSDGSVTELPVCSGCGATPKYYVPMNDVGMQVPPYCHECGSRMEPVVKMEVEK